MGGNPTTLHSLAYAETSLGFVVNGVNGICVINLEGPFGIKDLDPILPLWSWGRIGSFLFAFNGSFIQDILVNPSSSRFIARFASYTFAYQLAFVIIAT